MSNQTLRRTPAARSGGKNAGTAAPARASTNRPRKQTARLSHGVRRDGKPLIFGWGGHLSNLQKTRYKQRAAYAFFGVVIAAVIVVAGFGLLQQNVLIPNQSIVTVNGTGISQDTYRKYLAYRSELLWNKLKSEIAEQQSLAAKVQAGDAAASRRNQVLGSLIQTDESSFQQSSITQESVGRLVDDQLLQKGIKQFQAAHVPASAFTPTAKAVADQLASFKKGFPQGETYAHFLSVNHISENDVKAAITIDVRRDLMSTYLSSIIKSPSRQLHLRRIELQTAKDAANELALLKKGDTGHDWATLAKKDSQDAQTKNIGGDMGWVFRGGADGAIEDWAFAPTRKVNDISPVIKDVSGTFDVVQILGIDPSRAVDAAQLSSAQSDALDHYLNAAHVLPGNSVSTPDSTMLTASRNMPVAPNLNATLPNENPGGSGPLPGQQIPGQQ
jgi:parvulin-like peptidyl-prolyl isomerase